MPLPQIRQPARTAKRFLAAISPNQARFRLPTANCAAANFQAPKFPTREDGVSAAASTEEQGKFLFAGSARLKTALPRRKTLQLRQKPKSFHHTTLLRGETIPRQGGCNISRRAHLYVARNSVTTRLSGTVWQKAITALNKFPFRRRVCLSKAFFNQNLARRAAHFRFEKDFQAFSRAGPPASKNRATAPPARRQSPQTQKLPR